MGDETDRAARPPIASTQTSKRDAAQRSAERRFYLWFGAGVLGLFVLGFGVLTSGWLSVFFDPS